MREIHGVNIPFEIPPRRVVSLVPSLTQTLFELNLGARVVGVTDYCTEPAEEVAALPRVGGPQNPDIERVAALHPDLVMADDDDNRDEDIEALREKGLGVWRVAPRTLADAIALLWATMYAFEDTSMIPRVRHIEQVLDYLELAAAQSEPVPVFVPIWRGPWMTINRETYIHDLLRACGGANVFAGRDERYFAITQEDIVAAQPRVILLPQDDPYAFGPGDVDDIRTLDIPAAHDDRIHLVEGKRLIWYGTQAARSLGELPQLIVEATEYGH